MPPTASVIIRQADGKSLILSENDRIVKEVTIPCSSPRCSSRHGQESPVSFTFNDQDPFPESGDQFMSLILPETSPSNLGYPLPFCGPSCLRDYLNYVYIAPGPRQPAGEQALDKIDDRNLATNELVQKTDEEVDTSDIPEVLDWSKAEVEKFYRPSPVDQADGAGDPGDEHV